jgi:hypothetical protein
MGYQRIHAIHTYPDWPLAGHLLLHLHDSRNPMNGGLSLKPGEVSIDDPFNHTNQGPFREANGVIADTRFTVRFHKDGEGMQTLRFLPEHGG